MAASILAKVFRFVVWGIPAFLIAIPLNYVLVERAAMLKPAAYAVVLAVQVTINFFACYFFVFKSDRATRLWKQFLVFLNGIILFRLADWGLYVLLTGKLGLPFLWVQLFNVAAFGLLKFEFCRRVFEAKSPVPRPDQSGGPGLGA